MTTAHNSHARPPFLGSIRARLTGIVALFAVALATTVAVLTWIEADGIYSGRQDELRIVTQVAYSVVERQYDDYKSGKISEAEAQERAKANLRSMRYHTNDYFFVENAAGVTIVHGVRPEVEGTDGSQATDPTGKHYFTDMKKVAEEQGEGFVSYQYPKPGMAMDKASPKLSFVKAFGPWQWTIGTGVYIDDISAMVWRRIYISTALAIGFLLVIGGFAGLVVKELVRRLDLLSGVMTALASGDNEITVPKPARDDEIGQMTKAVGVFKANAVERARLERETESQRAAAEAERSRTEAQNVKAAEEQAEIVRRLGEGLRNLAAGDLRVRLGEGFTDKYAQIRNDFNEAIDKLKETILSVVTSAAAIETGTQEISSASDDLSRRTEHQAATLEQTASALDAITATVKKSAEGAVHAREVAAAADSDAKQSAQVVRQAVDAMDAIAKSSGQIGQIIGVIDEIAFQTNLLALNAGVEAARAGDAGKGFAVVASEVRALAQRSADAAKEIKGLITTSTTQVDQGVKLVAETGKSLERIMAQVSEINAVIGGIADGAKEQATGLAEVNSAINQMDQVTQQNAAMVEESTAASHSLASEAEALTKLVAQFRIGAAMDNAAPPAVRKAPPARPKAAPSHRMSAPAAAQPAEEWAAF